MNTITGNDLINIGFTESKALGIALLIVENKLNHLSKEEQLTLLAEVVKQPAVFENDPILLPLVQELNKPASDVIELNGQSLPYAIYGAEAIEEGALKQMQIAMKLPITVAGALMPDAH